MSASAMAACNSLISNARLRDAQSGPLGIASGEGVNRIGDCAVPAYETIRATGAAVPIGVPADPAMKTSRMIPPLMQSIS
jgi:hypothetical protein